MGRKVIIMLIFLLLCKGYSFAQHKGEVILINSAVSGDPKTKSLIEFIQNEVEGSGYVLKYEELRAQLIQDVAEVQRKQRQLRSAYPNKPTLVLFIGDPAWLICQPLFDDIWLEVPAVMIYGQKYMPATIESLLKKEVNDKKKMVLASSFQRRYNFTSILYPYYLEETIRVMKRMLPAMSNIAFISDYRYISAFVEAQLKEEIGKKFPELGLISLRSSEILTKTMLDTLSSFDRSTGILFFSWYTPKEDIDQGYFNENIPRFVSAFSQNPVFIAYDRTDFAVEFAGGYYISDKDLNKNVAAKINAILRGRAAREVPVEPGGRPQTYLNYLHLETHQINSFLYPKDAVFSNAPPTFFQRHGLLIVFVGAVIWLFIGWGILRIRLYMQQQRQQANEIGLLEQYRRLIDTMPLVYVHKERLPGKDFLFVRVNTAFEELFKCRREDVVNRKLSELVIEFPHLDVLKGEGLSREVFSLPDKNGQVLHFEKMTFRIASENDYEMFCVDRTDERNAMIELEENSEVLRNLNDKYRLVLQATRMAPWTWDLTENTINSELSLDKSFNSVDMLKALSADSPEFNFSQAIHPDDTEKVHDSFMRFIRGEASAFQEQYRVLKQVQGRPKEYMWVQTNAIVAKRNAEGKPEMLVGGTLDIDNQKKMEQDLRRAKELAEESNRLKSAFIANMSHEIRTPLNAIIGFSEMITSAENDEERDLYIHHINVNNALLLKLINDVLDLSKIEAGMFELTTDVVDLYGMFCEQEGKMSRDNHNPNVSILFDTQSGHCVAQIDSAHLMQMMNNLLSNAIKFTRSGEIHFGYTIVVGEEWLEFYVSDTGSGIPSDKLDAIFGRFVKLDNFVQGTGLGLSICQNIVEKMGGRIWVKSEVGKGSVFRFRVPFVKADMSV